jgi:hypothetical protein
MFRPQQMCPSSSRSYRAVSCKPSTTIIRAKLTRWSRQMARASIDCCCGESLALPSLTAFGTVRVMVSTKPLPASAIAGLYVEHQIEPQHGEQESSARRGE